MADEGAKAAWVKRVLGVEPGSGGGATARAFNTALAGWQAALATVDGQIETLQAILRGSPDSELHDIAEFGLNAMTGDHKVKIETALIEMRGGTITPRAAGTAVSLIGSFQAHLAGDERIAACDANPFGVKLSLRETLTPALQGLKVVLQG
ncbi:MAG TPA: hypothetical protein VFW75_02150 [Acetobacteraceae bacterium]|nr:hypothetical protein [Acetobacteraceae bacterium]